MQINNKKVAVLAILFVVVLTLGITLAVVPTDWLEHVDHFENICVHEAYAMIKYQFYSNITILDVRTQSEYDAGHIAGAINIPWDQLDEYFHNGTCPLIGSEWNMTIVCCAMGGRSSRACDILYDHAFKYVYNMVGGINEWTNPVWNYTVVTTTALPPPVVHTISVTEAYEMILNGSCALIVDVRTPTEYSLGHIVNQTSTPRLDAINIPYYNDLDFAARSAQALIGHKNDPIIVYCANTSTCGKSGAACNYLVSQGYYKVYNLAIPDGGGLDAWKSAGYPIGAPVASGTFGYPTIGGSSTHFGQGNVLFGCKFASPSSSVVVTRISCYLSSYTGTTNAMAFIYSDGGGAPDSILATSAEVTGIGTTASWINFTISYTTTGGTDYWLAVVSSSNAGFRYTTGTTNQFCFAKGAPTSSWIYPNAPNPWATRTYRNFQMSIFAEYTA